MFKVLYIDDRAPEVQRTIDQFVEDDILNRPNNFQLDVIPPITFEEMGRSIYDRLVEEQTYHALILDWNLSESVTEADYRASYRAAELGQFLRREVAERERGDACFPIFIVSAQQYIDSLYTKDRASHDIFDSVYKKELFFNRQSTTDIINDITLFIHAYQQLQELYKHNYLLKSTAYPALKDIFTALLKKTPSNLDSIINFSEINIPHPYGYLKFIHHELLKKAGPLIPAELVAARLGIELADLSAVLPHLLPYKYAGVMSSGFDRWWMDEINLWWQQNISPDPLVFLDAAERVRLLNSKLQLHLQPAKTIADDYSNFYWYVSKVTQRPVDESDAINIQGHKKFDWQENEYISKQDYLQGEYELQANESISNEEIFDKFQ